MHGDRIYRLPCQHHQHRAFAMCSFFGCSVFDPNELTELRNIPLEKLRPFFPDLVKGSFESDLESAVARTARATKSSGATGAAMPSAGGGGALSQFTVDLTEQARQGRIDPVLGRDNEIRQIMDILMRRRQNNPILTGKQVSAKRLWSRDSLSESPTRCP